MREGHVEEVEIAEDEVELVSASSVVVLVSVVDELELTSTELEEV